LDILLFEILQSFLLPCTGNTDDLLEGDAGLGTFSARIHAAYRLGLIGSELARALHVVRKIRDSVAHDTSAHNLSTGSHRDRIRQLVAPLRAHKTFDEMKQWPPFAGMEGASRDFRMFLAVACARLWGRLEHTTTVSAEHACSYLPDLWEAEPVTDAESPTPIALAFPSTRIPRAPTGVKAV
jgi:hypothetical protein